jgi:hypothetical protein
MRKKTINSLMPIDKAAIGSDLRSLIEYYTELTVEEHMTGKINKEADQTWNKILVLIHKLVEEKDA